jgi:hypothetical protein
LTVAQALRRFIGRFSKKEKTIAHRL